MSAARVPRETARERERPTPGPDSLGMGDLLAELAALFEVPDDGDGDRSGLRRAVHARACTAREILVAVRAAGDLGSDLWAEGGRRAVEVVGALAALAGDQEVVVEDLHRRVEQEVQARGAADDRAVMLREGLVDALAGHAPRSPMALALALLPPDPHGELAAVRAVLTRAVAGDPARETGGGG